MGCLPPEQEMGQGPHFLWELMSLEKESQELRLRLQPAPTSSRVKGANTLAVTPQPQTEPAFSPVFHSRILISQYG